jgi:hypothetical protein
VHAWCSSAHLGGLAAGHAGELRWTIEENFQAGKGWELAFYRCYAPQPVSLAALVKAAGLTGLDEHRVRSWTSWHRWVTLAMLASAFLAIAAAAERAGKPGPAGQISLTRNEIASLFAHLTSKPADSTRHRLRWSAWRA